MSRFLDERGRIFGKVNVVDILVLLVIVAVVVFAVVRLTGGGSATIPVKVTFIAKEVRNSEAETLRKSWQPGTPMTDESGIVLGKILSVGVASTREEYLTSTDELKEFDSPIFSDVTVVVLGQGQVSNNSARIGTVSVLRFAKVTVLGGKNTFQLLVEDLQWGPGAVQ